MRDSRSSRRLGLSLVVVGLVVLQRTARSFPHLFQAMGLMLYTTQILLLAIVLAVFKHTTLFDTKTFAFTLLGAASVVADSRPAPPRS